MNTEYDTILTIEYNILTIYIFIPILCQNFGDTKHQNRQNLSTLDQESIKANRQISYHIEQKSRQYLYSLQR